MSFTYMSCKPIRLLETIFPSSKSMPAYLQYGNALFASWSCHTPLTGLQGPDLSPTNHSCDTLGWWVHDRIPSQLPIIPNLNTNWLNNDNVFHKGVGFSQRLLLSMSKRLIESIHNDGVHRIYGLQYINL